MSACRATLQSRCRRSAQAASQLPKRPTKRGFFEGCARRSAGSLPSGRPVYRAHEKTESARRWSTRKSNDVSAGPTGAPVNRDARREPEVIEGEIAAREPDDSVSAAGPAAAETRADPPARRAAPRTGARGFLGGAIAGLIVSALGLGAGYTFFRLQGRRVGDRGSIERARSAGAADNDAIAAEAKRESAAVATLEKRIGALEAGAGSSNTADLDKRVAALEAAGAGNGAASDATQRLAAQAKDLRADVDAEKGATS